MLMIHFTVFHSRAAKHHTGFEKKIFALELTKMARKSSKSDPVWPDFFNKTTPEERFMNSYPDSSIVREYRITLPLSVEEYHVGQLYGVAEASKAETGGGEGVEVRVNEPFEYASGLKGQYTFKVIHLSSKVPGYVRALAPAGALEMYEEAWNAYPFCRTVYTNGYMKDSFFICLDSWHKEGKDDAFDNVHDLKQAELIKRTVDKIDILNDPIEPSDYKDTEDPSKFKSVKAGRGPLQGASWADGFSPLMCAYKLYRVKFKWRFLQNKVESMIMKNVRRLLLNFHRQVFCWLDRWYGMTMEDIRELEERTKHELDDARKNKEFAGSKIST